MNILFVTNKNVDPLIGGIERITYSLTHGFRQQGFCCFSLYTRENNRGTTTENVFIDKYLLTPNNIVEQIADHLSQWQIDTIIAQGSDAQVNNLMPALREAVNLVGRGKILFVFHNMPGQELISMNGSTLWHRLWHLPDKRETLKEIALQLLLPFAKPILRKCLKKKYATPYLLADKVVLLSKGFIPLYAQLTGLGEDKFAVIGNALSYASTERTDKEKSVLLVARLDERQKRVRTTLQVWRQIEKTHTLNDWHLTIVGYGPDETYYHQLAKRWHLTRVTFTGLADPQPYYQKASIFMMTSAYEGWPLTLVEALQNRCIPIAFDSFAAVHDVIQNGYNGFILTNNDVDGYTERLQQLMIDNQLRQRMAEQCCQSATQFTVEKVVTQWIQLFNSL